LTTSSPLT